MPNYLVVTTTTETPRLYLSQRPYEEIMRALRSWPESHNVRSFVFAIQPLPQSGANPYANPTGCTQLRLEGVVNQTDEVATYQYLWGNAIEDLPTEQALHAIQSAQDYLDKKRVRVEGLAKEAETTTGS